MCIQLILTILYLIALALPAAGIGKAFSRDRKEHKKYERSDREEKRIAEKYRAQTLDIKQRKDAAIKDGSWGRNHDQLVAEENELNEKIRLEEEAHGVDRITYARFDEAIADSIRNHPKRNYLLRVDEIIFVGVGIVVGAIASIWSVWI